MNAIPHADRHPHDPADPSIDPVAFAMARLLTYLRWVEEHRATFIATRAVNPERAEAELANLEDAIASAHRHATRLAELLLSGAAVDRSKKLPADLARFT